MQRARWGWRGVALAAALGSSSAVACFFSLDPPRPASDRHEDAGTDAASPADDAPPVSDACAPPPDPIEPTCEPDAGFDTDPFNCGECGHICGAPCADGLCGGFVVRGDETSDLIVRGSTLYYASYATPNYGIASVPLLDGGARAVCAAAEPPGTLAVVGDTIYGLKWKNLYVCPTLIPPEGTPAEVVTLPASPSTTSRTLAATADALFVATDDARILRFDATNKAFVEVASGETIRALAADATDVYWIGESAGDFRLRRLRPDEGKTTPPELARLTAPTGLALSADDIFVGDGNAVYRMGKRGCPPATLEPVIKDVVRPSLLATDGRHVYFTQRFDAGLWPLQRADVLGRKRVLTVLPDTVDYGFNYIVTDEWLVHGRATGSTIRRLAL